MTDNTPDALDPRSGSQPAGGAGPLAARRPLGELSVAPLCLGGNVFGWTADEATSFDVLDAYTAAGGNFIDTADAYMASADGLSGGESETVIGDWMARRSNRDDVVVATKVGVHPERKGLRAATIKAAADDSLRRLRTEHIDLYYTHYDDESVEVEEIVTALDDLVRAGKVRQIAASNISPERLEASLRFSGESGAARYSALQPHYNLVSRDTYEGELASVAERHGLAVLPYFALASGYLTGKYRQGRQSDGARDRLVRQYLDSERNLRVLDVLDHVADAHRTTPATIALAWLLTRPTVTAPIASARTTGQLPSLLALGEVELTEAETAELTETSAP